MNTDNEGAAGQKVVTYKLIANQPPQITVTLEELEVVIGGNAVSEEGLISDFGASATDDRDQSVTLTVNSTQLNSLNSNITGQNVGVKYRQVMNLT